MNTINGITPLPLAAVKQSDLSDVSQAKAGFGAILSSTLNSVNNSQIAGDKAVEKLVSELAKKSNFKVENHFLDCKHYFTDSLLIK